MGDKGFLAMFVGVLGVGLLTVVAYVGFWAFVVWAIYKLVMHFTGDG